MMLLKRMWCDQSVTLIECKKMILDNLLEQCFHHQVTMLFSLQKLIMHLANSQKGRVLAQNKFVNH